MKPHFTKRHQKGDEAMFKATQRLLEILPRLPGRSRLLPGTRLTPGTEGIAQGALGLGLKAKRLGRRRQLLAEGSRFLTGGGGNCCRDSFPGEKKLQMELG